MLLINEINGRSFKKKIYIIIIIIIIVIITIIVINNISIKISCLMF